MWANRGMLTINQQWTNKCEVSFCSHHLKLSTVLAHTCYTVLNWDLLLAPVNVMDSKTYYRNWRYMYMCIQHIHVMFRFNENINQNDKVCSQYQSFQNNSQNVSYTNHLTFKFFFNHILLTFNHIKHIQIQKQHWTFRTCDIWRV